MGYPHCPEPRNGTSDMPYLHSLAQVVTTAFALDYRLRQATSLFSVPPDLTLRQCAPLFCEHLSVHSQKQPECLA